MRACRPAGSPGREPRACKLRAGPFVAVAWTDRWGQLTLPAHTASSHCRLTLPAHTASSHCQLTLHTASSHSTLRAHTVACVRLVLFQLRVRSATGSAAARRRTVADLSKRTRRRGSHGALFKIIHAPSVCTTPGSAESTADSAMLTGARIFISMHPSPGAGSNSRSGCGF